jgi:antitoxin ParD1/3/4
MPSTINISLTDELRAFLDSQCGDGTMYATPSEYIRSMLRAQAEERAAYEFKSALLEGLNDIATGRTIPLDRPLNNILDDFEAREHTTTV